MKRFLLTLSSLAAFGSFSFGETPSGPITLWNGKDFAGWEYITLPAVPIEKAFQISATGTLVALTGKPNGLLQTTTDYENYAFHAEWRWASPAKNNNSGFFVHITGGPKDHVWPVSLQIQNKPDHAGDLIPMAGATFAEMPPAPAKQMDRTGPSSEKPIGEWNTCDIICRGDTVECRINGVLENRATHVTPHSGKVGLQIEGYPLEWRAITLAPLTAVSAGP